MDLFIYHAAVKELQLCKTVDRLEKLVREYSEVVKKLHMFDNYTPSTVPETEQILYYKLLTLAIKLHSNKSKKILPEFIKTRRDYMHRSLLNAILGWGIQENSSKKCFVFTKLISYEQFMNWFEFDITITLPDNNTYVEQLNTIIDNKSIHFNIEFNNILTSFDSCSTNLTRTTQQLIYATRYKQVNFPDKPQTIWDLFIAESTSLAHKLTSTQVQETVLKLEQQITAIQSLGDYYDKQ